MKCPYSQNFGKISSLIYPLSWNASFVDWLDSFRIQKDTDSLCHQTQKVLQIPRNKLIFKHTSMLPSQICYSAAAMTLQNWHVNPPSPHRKKIHRDLICWKPPDPNYIKLNFDGSMKHNHQAAAGFVMRDSEGNPLLASAKDIGHSSVLVAEAMGSS